MIRVAMVATPAPLRDMRPAPGFLDGDMIRARLPLADAGFELVDLDPSVDLAVQIEESFDRGDVPADAAILFYASCRVLLGDEDELFLTLDVTQPDTGDSLRDIALLFRDRASGPVALFLELRHTPDLDDPFRSAAIVAAAKAEIVALGGAVEMLIAANPVAEDDEDDRASALTRAFIEALDQGELEEGLTLAQFFAEARDRGAMVETVRCFAHVKGATPFEILPPVPPPPASVATIPSAPPPESDEEPAQEADEPREAPATIPEHALAPEVADEQAPSEAVAPVAREPIASASSVSSVASDPAREEPPPPEEESRSSSPAIAREPSRTASIDIALDFAETPMPGAASSTLELAPVLPPAPPPPPPREEEPVSTRPVTPEPIRQKGPVAKGIAASDHVALGNALKDAGDLEAALASYKRALGMLAPSASTDRAEIYVRLGQLKERQDKRREAIANHEKALGLFPPLEDGNPARGLHRVALEARISLNVAEGDLRAVASAEDGLLAAVTEDERYELLVRFGRRWQDETRVLGRARASFERARALRGDTPPDGTSGSKRPPPSDALDVLERLASLYDEAGMVNEALATAERLAEVTPVARDRAARYFALGTRCMGELHKEELGLKLFEKALTSDPTMLEPLAVIARVLAERQEWSELEHAYRRMLDRMATLPEGQVRRDVTFELCLRLGLLFRDHLDDAGLALDAIEDALVARPSDLSTRLMAAELARSQGAFDREAHHLAKAAGLEPRRAETYHELFEANQKLRRPDQAFQAASVAVHVGVADDRERFIFEEQRGALAPTPTFVLPAEGWAWLRPTDHEPHAEAVLAAIAPAAISVRLAALANEGRLPSLDASLRQDVERSTVSIVRSFGWACHFLNVPVPAIYLNDDPALGLAAVIAEDPTVMVGTKAQRGRSPTELAFLVGRHLGYHVGSHRLLLYYPSMDELTACFLAAVRIVQPDTPAPAPLRQLVNELQRGIALRLSDASRAELKAAVAVFEAAGSRVHLAEWASDVERCATRAGLLISGDLGASITVLRGEPRQVLEANEKIGDLLGFAVSEEHHALRESLGIAIQP